MAALEVQLEQMEAKMSEGAEVDLDLFNRLTGNLRRCFETIGVERRPRQISDSLDDVIDRVAARRAGE